MKWSADGSLSDQTTDADCDSGKVITLRRLDAAPALSYTGNLQVDISAPPLRSCGVTISVTPL